MPKKARFWGQDPRFALIGDNHYPVILKEYLTDGFYSEDLTEFHGYREQFFALAERRSKAVLAQRKKGDEEGEWKMESFHDLTDVQMAGNTFKCEVGPQLAPVEEEQSG